MSNRTGNVLNQIFRDVMQELAKALRVIPVGFDGSDYPEIKVDADGTVHVTGTVTSTPSGTQDVQITGSTATLNISITNQDVDIRDLSGSQDDIVVKGGSNSGMQAVSDTITVGTERTLINPGASETVRIFQVVVTNGDTALRGIDIYEEGNSADPEIAEWLAAEGGGFKMDFGPDGLPITQGDDLKAILDGAPSTNSVKVTVIYKLDT